MVSQEERKLRRWLTKKGSYRWEILKDCLKEAEHGVCHRSVKALVRRIEGWPDSMTAKEARERLKQLDQHLWKLIPDLDRKRWSEECDEPMPLLRLLSAVPETGVGRQYDEDDKRMPEFRWLLFVEPESCIHAEACQIADAFYAPRAQGKDSTNRPELFELYFLLRFLGAPEIEKVWDSMGKRAKEFCRASEHLFTPEKATCRILEPQILEKLPKLVRMNPEEAFERLKLSAYGMKPAHEFSKRCYDFSVDLLKTEPPIGRENHLKRIRSFIHGRNAAFFTIAGGPGTGKTTLFCAALKEHHQSPHFLINARHGERSRPSRILEHLTHAAQHASGTLPQCPIPTSEDNAAELFEQALLEYAERKPEETLVIFIDALDETEENRYGEQPLTRLLLRLAEQEGIPENTHFVITSRPTGDLQNLIEQVDIDLDEEDQQNEAIKHFYETQFAEADITIEAKKLMELIEKTQRSFLYASLAATCVIKEVQATGDFDPKRAPDGLEEQMEREWERIERGPVDVGNATDILAVVAAHRSSLTLADVEQITGLRLSVIRRFVSPHEYLFEFMEQGRRPLSHDSTLKGYRHLHTQEHFEDRIGPNGMRHAHRQIGEWLLGQHGTVGIATAPSLFRTLIEHLYAGEEWAQVVELVLTDTYVYSLATSPEGKSSLPYLYRLAVQSAAKLRNARLVIATLARICQANGRPLAPCASLSFCMGQKDRALSLLGYMKEGETKDIERMRLAYLNRREEPSDSWELPSGLRLMRPPTLRQLGSLRAEILMQREPPTAWYLPENSTGFEQGRRGNLLVLLLRRFAFGLAAAGTRESFVYFAEFASGFRAGSVASAIVPFARCLPREALSILLVHPDRWLDWLCEAELRSLGAILSEENMEKLAEAFTQQGSACYQVAGVVAFCSGGQPLREAPKHPCSSLQQARLVAHLQYSITELELSHSAILNLVTDWRFRLPALEILAGMETRIRWNHEVNSLCTFLSSKLCHRPSEYMRAMLDLLTRHAVLSVDTRAAIADLFVTLYDSPDISEWKFVDLLASFAGSSTSAQYLGLIRKDARWFLPASLDLSDFKSATEANYLATHLMDLFPAISDAESDAFDVPDLGTPDACERRLREFIRAFEVAERFPAILQTLDGLSYNEVLTALKLALSLDPCRRSVLDTQLLECVTNRYLSSQDWCSVLAEVVALFAGRQPASIGELLMRPESAQLDVDEIFMPP